jgi:hypothetical protein
VGQGLGGEGSRTGHQLLSDYIIPDIKTTHTAWVPAGGPPKGGRGRSLGQPCPQANSYFSPGARSWARMWALHPCTTSGRTPQKCPAVAGSPRVRPTRPQPREAPERRPRPRDRSAVAPRHGSPVPGRGRSVVSAASPRPPR